MNGEQPNGHLTVVFTPPGFSPEYIIHYLHSGILGGHIKICATAALPHIDRAACKHNPSYTSRRHIYEQGIESAVNEFIRAEANSGFVFIPHFINNDRGPDVSFGNHNLLNILRNVLSVGINIQIINIIEPSYLIQEKSISGVQESLILRHIQSCNIASLISEMKMTDGHIPYYILSSLSHISNLKILAEIFSPTSIYLCHPINVYRRNPSDSSKSDLNNFRTLMREMGCVTIDPLSVDEEIIISNRGVVEKSTFIKINKIDIMTTLTNGEQLSGESPFKDQDSIIIDGERNSLTSRTAKSQVPSRDFEWIFLSDAVASWRPFLYNQHHAGVLSELQFAHHNNIPVFAFSSQEDGEERPSPFASMTTSYDDFGKFCDALKDFVSMKNLEKNRISTPPKYCDHTSVGVLIYNEKEEVLLIDRNTFPYKKAPPAGHVDGHSSYEEAAIAEVEEEVGLKICELELIAEGRQENPCRRINGNWHYWKIYLARADGDIHLSEREAKAYEWCSHQRLQELGLIDIAVDDVESASIEEVWREWFKTLKILQR